jgi:hypothetical protein
VVDVMVLAIGLGNHCQTNEKGETHGKIQTRSSTLSVDSTGPWPVSFGWSYAKPLFNVALWSTFLEGTEKIHMLVLVAVTARYK